METPLIIELPCQTRSGRESSSIEPLSRQNGQFKNKIGVEMVRQVLLENNVPCFIDDNNNLNFKDGKTSEIRTSFASFNGGRKNFWFNQIRPNINNWDYLHLVCVHPDKVEVYEYTKYEALELCKDAAGLDHIGQEGQLLAINVFQSKNRATYWKLDCYGKKIAEFSTNKIRLKHETK